MAASEDRTALDGLEERLFKLVSKNATSAQWAEWLRAPLEHAVAEGDKNLALSLLKAGANGGAGWKGCDGRTLLDAAVVGGNNDVVSTLLLVGGPADLNALSGAKNVTALHRVSEVGHSDVAYTLLVEGADVGLVDSEQRSALHYALQGGHRELSRHVLVAGADVNAKDHGGDTPLHLAAVLDDENLVRTLLRRGARVDAANAKGQRALHVAVEQKRTGSAEALLKAGADPNVRFTRSNDSISNRCSPLYFARDDSEMAKVLMQHGANVNAKDSIGYTSLHWAVKWGGTDVIDALVEGGADLEARSSSLALMGYDFEGLTPLHTAAYSSLENVSVLLRKGADINVRDDNGLTPLHVVCKTSAKDASALQEADFLLRKGADETLTDNEGRTPKDLIESRADRAESLRRLLANAPADRAWRRRGMLVLCRAHSAKALGVVGDGESSIAQCQGKEVAAAGGYGCVMTRVIKMEAEEVFRSIVRFL